MTENPGFMNLMPNRSHSGSPSNASTSIHDLKLVTTANDLGKRLDVFVAENALGISRSKINLLIRNGFVTVDGKPAKSSDQLRPSQTVFANLSQLETLKPDQPVAEDIPLDVIYEDDAIIAINKPAGMVVHPAKGHWAGTLTGALVNHFQQLSTVGGSHRPGIVHRLDRDTSGVIVVAKTDLAHMRLTRQFEKRSVEKKYLAVVSPPPERDRDLIDQPIGVHPYQREKMAIRKSDSHGKPATTFYEVKARWGRFAIVNVFPKTGRTHQIRIHLAHIGSPVVADRLYSGRSKATTSWIRDGREGGEIVIQRQALHAHSISFKHPLTNQPLTLEAPLAEDIQKLIEAIEQAA